jgi:hypothetical protein
MHVVQETTGMDPEHNRDIQAVNPEVTVAQTAGTELRAFSFTSVLKMQRRKKQ